MKRRFSDEQIIHCTASNCEANVESERACDILRIDRSSVHYKSVRPNDTELREAMKKVATERRRFGYRRIHVMLERQGIIMNQKKLRRLYREEKLPVRKRGGRKRALGTRKPMLFPFRMNERLLSAMQASPAGQWEFGFRI